MGMYSHIRLIVKVTKGKEEEWEESVRDHTWINDSVLCPPSFFSDKYYPVKRIAGERLYEYRPVTKRFNFNDIVERLDLLEDFVLFMNRDFESMEYMAMVNTTIDSGHCPYFTIENEHLTLINGTSCHPDAIVKLEGPDTGNGFGFVPDDIPYSKTIEHYGKYIGTNNLID